MLADLLYSDHFSGFHKPTAIQEDFSHEQQAFILRLILTDRLVIRFYNILCVCMHMYNAKTINSAYLVCCTADDHLK
jgi:hypothetical protein